MSAEELAKQAADRVREVVSEAESRAEEIVRAAEREASEIRERAESEGREILDRARRALSELAGETHEPPTPGFDPTPPAPTPDPGPPPTPAPDPGPPGPPSPGPEISAGNGDDAAARLVAMKLAVDGKAREEIEAELNSKFGASDRSSLLDDVLARAGK